MMRLIRVGVTLALALLVGVSLAAQTQGVDILLSKARSLEARGRMDLAAQNWKQVLLANPNETEALAGLARYAKQNGETEEERGYLDRLRKINPKDPHIAEVEKMHVITPQERDRLDEAGRLAMQHKPDEAMKIYREVFGNGPPSGKWAEPYYQTEAASTGGREKAVAQLRRLCAQDKSNEVYRLWLGRVLVYDPKTRMEGLQSLESIHDPGAAEQARTEWRQALLWEQENPAVLASVDAYLKRYPDQQLQGIQRSLREKQERAAEEASKQRGFQALRNKDMRVAEAQFEEVLRRSPNDVNAIAGLAFVRLNQKRFDEAITLFDRARALAPKRADLREGYETAKFWSLMEQGSSALQANQPEAAIAAYQQALALHPRDEQAMLGIAQAEARQKRLPDAEVQFQNVLNQSPNNADALAGLAFIRLQQKRFEDAVNLFDKARRLLSNRADIEQGYQEAKYWALMQRGATALDQNRAGDAISDYHQALALKPGAVDALRGLAGAAERSQNYPEAVRAYSQLTAANPADAQSWLALVRTHIRAKDPKAALETAKRIPPAAKSQIETRSDYLSELALLYYSTKQPDEGDRMLRRAMAAAAQADTTDALNARLEVASTLVDQGKLGPAIEVYQQATKLHPDNTIAWAGLIGAYARQRDFARAKTAVRSMPKAVYESASRDSGFLNSVAAVYSADGQCSEAEDMLNRSLHLDRAAGRQPAEWTQLQLADIWVREGNYAKARQGYRQIIAQNQNSTDAWRGYITTLHSERDDRNAVAEVQRMPAAVRAQLEKDAGFLTTLASAHSALGQTPQTVQLLQQARTIYQEQGQTPPPELDVQLAWAMLADRQRDPRDFLRKTRSRADLNEKQRGAISEIWSIWSVRAADAAFDNKKPDQAVAILTDAQRELPNNPKIYSALASLYLRQRDYQKALSVYESWGMRGADAGDYRAAVGTALAAHKNDSADLYLDRGLQHFPDDPDLLEMKGKRAAAQGNYKEAQGYLKSALRAAQNPATQRRRSAEVQRGARLPANPAAADTTGVAIGQTASSPQVPACRQTTSYVMRNDFSVGLARHARLVRTAFREQDNGDQTNDQNSANQNSANQTSANQNSANPKSAADSAVNPQKEQQIQDEIDVVQNRNTPYVDIGNVATGRAGDAGIDRLIIEDGIFGGSVTAGNRVRVSALTHGIYLYSGTPNGQSSVPFGTLAAGTPFAQQTEGGITGELQVSTPTLGLDFSASPSAFPVQNLTGGIRFRPFGGPVTFMAVRDSVKDSLLSYAGTTDPGTGLVWGGVVSNTGTLQIEHKAERSGQYLSASGSYITGKNVPENWAGSAGAGLYWVVANRLSLGLNLTGMHYDKNLSFFSLGQGGYFSPQEYALASIPISWFSRHKRFEYELRASLGAQYISQDSSPIIPIAVGVTVPPQLRGFYASDSSIGPNYSAALRLGYRVAPHVYFDIFGSANNASNYAFQTVGFSLKFLAHRLPTNTDLHVNSIPDWKGNQPFGIR